MSTHFMTIAVVDADAAAAAIAADSRCIQVNVVSHSTNAILFSISHVYNAR